MKARIFDPLPADHPLVTDGTKCFACDAPFNEGQRVMLTPREPVPARHVGIVEAMPVHATCALHGTKVKLVRCRMAGVTVTIDRVVDGHVPFPLICDSRLGRTHHHPDNVEEV